ncbi:MAG: hypothetical protein HN368_02945 [Spirochaetales bacterium]|jgi:hypothetical protein|nr:hypothetical protein [Spirochaetales bacterium]
MKSLNHSIYFSKAAGYRSGGKAMQIREEKVGEIDCDFPGGNIIVEDVSASEFKLRQDLRDTDGDWFYWAFRFRKNKPSRITFRFSGSDVFGVRGPAVSMDSGESWNWLGAPSLVGNGFTFDYPGGGVEVRFSMTMAYTNYHLQRLIGKHKEDAGFKRESLCTTDKGREVSLLRFGSIGRKPKFRAVLTSRSHACESMASYSLEGLVDYVLDDTDDGGWLRNNIEFLCVPFMDTDGVEDGDQGKNRIPRDHNRDFNNNPRYPAVRSLVELVPDWLGGVPFISLDLHCPHLRGDGNLHIYQVGQQDAGAWSEQIRFGNILESTAGGPLPYRSGDNLPFGQEWNTAEGFLKGRNCTMWLSSLPGSLLGSSIEIPYATARGNEVNQLSAKLFGHDLARAIRAYLSELRCRQ